MNYEEMSDLQINLLVANAIGVDAAENCGVVFASVKHTGDNVVSVIGAVDYCNNPSDAWPIVTGNGISLLDPEKCGSIPEWCATKFSPIYGVKDVNVYHTNPLRAAMIVFLMMKDEQNV